MTPDESAAHNAALERDELFLWSHVPERHCAYVQGATVTTWLGTVLGTIVRSRRWDQRGFYGTRVRMRSIVVQATNGELYHGRYGAQLVRLRRYRTK